MGKNIYIDLDRCVGCFACVVACIDQNYEIEQDGPSFRTVVKYENEKDQTIKYASIGCMHCEDSPCLFVCPTGAIYKEEDTGLVQVNREKCIGCRKCLKACPFEVPKFDKDNKMIKCDGCLERIRHGLEPVCVRTCPSKALKLKEGKSINSDKFKKKLQNL